LRGLHANVVAVIAEGLALVRLDDDRAIGPVRLLAGMAVEPEGAGLHEREAVGEGLAWGYAGIAEARHAVLREGQHEAVPVDRGRFREVVGHVDRDVLALPEPENGSGRGAVVADAGLAEIAGVDLHRIYGQRVLAGRRRTRESSRDSGAERRCPKHVRDVHGFCPDAEVRGAASG
jgi:hypothetical protein